MKVERINKECSMKEVLEENERLKAEQAKMQVQTDLALKKLEYALSQGGSK